MIRQAGAGLIAALILCQSPQVFAAESKLRAHFGLEATIYSSRSLEGSNSASPPLGGSSSSTQRKLDSSQFGFPAAAGLSLGLLLGNHFDLGTRFMYVSESTTSGTTDSAPTVNLTGVEFYPHLGYLTGSPGRALRFTVGFTAGYASTSVSTTSNSLSSSDSGLAMTELGGYLGVRGFVSDILSIDPTLMIMSSSASGSGGYSGIELSGTHVTFNIGFSLWSRGQRREPLPVPARAVAPQAPAPAAGNESSLGVAVSNPISSGVNLVFGSERSIIFKPTDGGTTATVIVRDSGSGNVIGTCRQLAFHAPNQQEVVLEAQSRWASSGSLHFPVLTTQVPLSALRSMVQIPMASNATASEHWVDVCDQRWNLFESEQQRLKLFVEALPGQDHSVSPNMAPQLGESTGAAVPATSSAAPTSSAPK